MSGLADILIHVDEKAQAENARALLHELENHLQHLIEGGETTRIDLSGLPLNAADYDLLESVLGHGEVIATVDSLGVSEVSDTAIPGIWRIEYYNSEEVLVAEYIEVTRCPELLQTPLEEMKNGLSLLHEAMARSDQGE
jgi:hydrogenase-1 operon protein HyaF